ncbi:MAG: hypothetical protein R6U32_07450 [Candidatus Woesearchaeota archaeon]
MPAKKTGRNRSEKSLPRKGGLKGHSRKGKDGGRDGRKGHDKRGLDSKSKGRNKSSADSSAKSSAKSSSKSPSKSSSAVKGKRAGNYPEKTSKKSAGKSSSGKPSGGGPKNASKSAPKSGAMDDLAKLKTRMKKVAVLTDHYNKLAGRKPGTDEELEETRSMMSFTKKQILRLCLESKKTMKRIESGLSEGK